MTQGSFAQSAPFGGFGPAQNPISRLRLALKRQRRFHQTRAELSRLTDRELADVSISRNRIDEIARQAAAMETL
jgi:uncharacterized protein YjiS (DUF1127 family)